MTDANKCHLCNDDIKKDDKMASFKDMIWHEKCLIAEACSDYVSRRYND